MRRVVLLAFLLVALAVVAAGCGGEDDGDEAGAVTTQPEQSCEKDQLELKEAGKLTIGTDNPAFPPWFEGGTPKGSKWEINDPAKGQGFEGAVA
jgi:polar amino acid transport system substrate-binding protein